MDNATTDENAILAIVNNWVIWSDSGDWERFATVWHDDAWMTATWFQGPASEFIKARREGFDRGVNIIHLLGATACDVVGTRAIAQSKMTIGQRAVVDGVLADVLCTGRFYDFFEKRNERWAIVRRQPIYEKDRIDPVDPAETLKLEADLLVRFPEGYRHLAYLQTKAGFDVRPLGLPGLRGPEVEKLYAEGKAWLEGAPTPGEPL